MKITGNRLAIAFVLCLVLSAGRAGAETWRQEATDDFVKGEWEGIIVRTPGGIQLDIQPADAVEVFDAPEAYVMGVCFFKGKLYAATSMGDEGPRNEKTAMLIPTGGIYEQSGKRWKKVVDLNSFITGSGRHRAVLGMEEFNGKIYTATQGAHSFDGTEWKAAPNAAGRGAFMNVARGKLYYGMPNQARSVDAEGKGQTAAKQPIDSWGIDQVHPFRGLVYMATGYACKLYNTRNINQPVPLWQHNTDDNIGGMAVYGGRLFLGTEGRKGEVWAMRTIDPGPAKAGGPGLTFDGCKWVWFPDKNLPSAPPGTYYFRRIVELDPKRKVRDATFMLAADDRLELFLNGSEVARSPEGGWAKVVLADVTKLMKAGKNIFGIAATNGGGAGGLIGRLIIEYASGEVETVNIDARWKSAKTAPKGWLEARFRDRGWSATQEFAGHGTRPWGKISVFRIIETAYESKHVDLVDDFDGLSDSWVSDVHAFRIYDGVLYAATGSPYFSRGIVSRFDGKKFAPIVKAKARHAYCMDEENGTLYVGTWPDGKVFAWQRKFIKKGSYVSPRINPAGKAVKAAKISWKGERNGGSLKVFASNDGGKTWKAARSSGRRVSFPAAGDDLRLKVEIRRGSATRTPVLQWWEAES